MREKEMKTKREKKENENIKWRYAKMAAQFDNNANSRNGWLVVLTRREKKMATKKIVKRGKKAGKSGYR